MTRSLRTLVGGAGMIVFVVLYALVAMALADSRPVQQSNFVVQVIVYVILGFAWVLPLMPVISWMEGRQKAEKRGA